MYDFSNNIKKYNELRNINESQNIGLFLNNTVDFNSMLYFIYPKDYYDNLSFFMIYPNLRNKFKQDILNDNCFLDSIIIQSDFLEFDKEFIKTFIKKCKLFDIKIICDFGQNLINLVDLKLDNESSAIVQFIINNVDVLILRDLSLKYEFNKYDNILIFPKIFTDSIECNLLGTENFNENNKFDNLIERDNLVSIKKFWNEMFSTVKRNKDTLLYEFIKDYFKEKLGDSFLNFLISKSYNIIERSQLFDSEWYYNQFKSDIKNMNPIVHYLDNEINNECTPSKLFHPKDYLENNFLCKFFKINPFVFHCLYKNRRNYFPFISDFNDNEMYRIIKQSNLFDSEWYLNKYPDIRASSYQTDPLVHYITFGYKEKNRNPNNYFSNEFYTKKYLFNNNTLNPLIHYIVWGQNNYFKANVFDSSSFFYSNHQTNEILMAFEKKISVVLVILNSSFKNIINCINSILKINYIKKDFYILLNKTHNSKFHAELKEFCIEKNISIIKMGSDENLFNCINHFIRNLNTDVFLFNDFIELSDSTLRNLIFKAYSEESIDMVIPACNSILHKEEFFDSDLPKLTNEGLSTLINRGSDNWDFLLEYINIFCFYIKENFLSKFGIDVKKCYVNPSKKMFYLAMKNQSNMVLCDSAYVYCNNEFFEEISKNSYVLNSFDFQYFENYEYLNGFKTLSNKISDIIHFTTKKNLSHRALYVLKEENLFLINDFYNVFNKESYEFYFLTFSSNKIILWYDNLKIREWSLDINYVKDYFNFFNYDEIENIYFSLLSSLDISVIHFDDLIYGSLNLINIANCFNIPVILNCNGFNYICPFNNIDLNNYIEDNTFCNFCKNNLLCDKKDFIENYKFESEKLFNQANLIIFPDNHIKDVFNRIFKGIDFEIKSTINPFDINLFELFNTNLTKGIKILVSGSLLNEKVIYDMKRYFGDLIEFHFLGDISDSLKDFGVFHGKFSYNLFINTLNEINPNFIGIFDIFDEIFEVLDISKNKKIPLLVEDIEELYDFIDDFKGVYFFKSDSLNNISQDFFNSENPKTYYNLLKDLYYSDNTFLDNIKKINGFHDELYFNVVQKKQKFIINPFDYIEKTTVNLSFFDFEEFLAKSYISPLFKSPFKYEDKRCLAFMDHVAKVLVNNLNKIKNKPLISILMVVSDYYGVSRAIESVLSQKYENFELIVINTADDVILNKILCSYADNRIKIINVVDDFGLNYYNYGLTYSKGEYIFYITVYNEWDERYLETMIGAFLELPDAHALYSGQFICDEYSIEGVCFAPFNKSLLRNKNFIDIGSFSHKKDIIQHIGGFENSLKYYNVWDFILKISDNFRIYSIPIIFSKFYYYSKFHDFSLINSNYIRLIQYRSINRVKRAEFELHHKVNIVIPSFESLNDIQECIEAILSFNLNDIVKIIVVDNNSNIAVKKYLKNLESNGQIKLILNDENYGFTYAVNQGISISDKSADILLLNNDAILTKGAIESMQRCAYEFNDSAIVVPQEVRAGGTPNLRGHVPFANVLVDCDVTPSTVSKNIINVPLFNHGEILELNFAPFFCTYIKRDVLDESLGLDAELGRHYRSDRIFSNYVRHIMNLKIYYVQEAIVFHKSQQSTKKLKKDKKDNDSFNIMVSKNQWEPHLAKKLGYKKPLWDD